MVLDAWVFFANEIHYEVHLFTLFLKRNATFHGAFLSRLNVHVMCASPRGGITQTRQSRQVNYHKHVKSMQFPNKPITLKTPWDNLPFLGNTVLLLTTKKQAKTTFLRGCAHHLKPMDLYFI